MFIILFFNLFNNSLQATGGWSSEGIIQDSDPRSPIMCKSTHLTSFAILVSTDIEGENTFQVGNVCILLCDTYVTQL